MLLLNLQQTLKHLLTYVPHRHQEHRKRRLYLYQEKTVLYQDKGRLINLHNTGSVEY